MTSIKLGSDAPVRFQRTFYLSVLGILIFALLIVLYILRNSIAGRAYNEYSQSENITDDDLKAVARVNDSRSYRDEHSDYDSGKYYESKHEYGNADYDDDDSDGKFKDLETIAPPNEVAGLQNLGKAAGTPPIPPDPVENKPSDWGRSVASDVWEDIEDSQSRSPEQVGSHTDDNAANSVGKSQQWQSDHDTESLDRQVNYEEYADEDSEDSEEGEEDDVWK